MKKSGTETISVIVERSVLTFVGMLTVGIMEHFSTRELVTQSNSVTFIEAGHSLTQTVWLR